MFFKKRISEKNSKQVLSDEQTPDDEGKETVQYSPPPVRKIIDGKLYDTSKATHICNDRVWYEKIPDYNRFTHYMQLGGEPISLYKGDTEWFIELYGEITPVGESWVKTFLGCNFVEKYIEIFGEPEPA